MGFNIMKVKLVADWRLLGGLDLTDIGNGFFMIKFDSAGDRNKVINDGPWTIFNHYLTVRLWTPKFNSSNANIDKTPCSGSGSKFKCSFL